MTKTVVLVGALDTKGVEFALVKDLIERAGLAALVVDFDVIGAPALARTSRSTARRSPRMPSGPVWWMNSS